MEKKANIYNLMEMPKWLSIINYEKYYSNYLFKYTYMSCQVVKQYFD